YELYLRANELARTYDGLAQARDMYKKCLDLDPSFAPAWARLGRCHRVIGKFIESSADSDVRAQEAFDRAIALNPRLSIAHKLYPNLEGDIGLAQRAMVRLLEQATRHGNDPELFAGLVHACRYCGLFDQSLAAHAEARRLDPHIPTSVEQTIHMTADFERYFEREDTALASSGDEIIQVVTLGLVGRVEEARAKLSMRELPARMPAFKPWRDFLMAWLERRPDEMRRIRATLHPLLIMSDPEATFQEAWFTCDAGDLEHGLDRLRDAIGRG